MRTFLPSASQFFHSRKGFSTVAAVAATFLLVSTKSTTTALSLSMSSSSKSQTPRNIVVVGGGIQGSSVAVSINNDEMLRLKNRKVCGLFYNGFILHFS